jgi:hypothetical protein
MQRTAVMMIALLTTLISTAQESGQSNSLFTNSADNLLSSDGRLTIGGYAQIDYNQPFGSETHYNGKLDIHRLVMLFGYNFSERTSFVTEIEFEHVTEVYVEQAFLQHRITDGITFRGGLMLIPMGIINEYHEPTTYNGVERPVIDSYLAPTTWREIGFGFTGVLLAPSIKYQAYLVNGFNSYNGSGTLNGSNGFRKGRQKGAESIMSHPNFTFKTEYFGIRGLNLGASGYFGNTSSSLFNGISKSDEAALTRSDSSIVGIVMTGLDGRFTRGGLSLRGQLYHTIISNSERYNSFTGQAGSPNDLGSQMNGYYIEASYNIFRGIESTDYELIPFIRYSNYNTHHRVDKSLMANTSYQKTIITTGAGIKLSNGAVIKCDIQLIKPESASTFSKTFNAGIGVMF